MQHLDDSFLSRWIDGPTVEVWCAQEILERPRRRPEVRRLTGCRPTTQRLCFAGATPRIAAISSMAGLRHWPPSVRHGRAADTASMPTRQGTHGAAGRQEPGLCLAGSTTGIGAEFETEAMFVLVDSRIRPRLPSWIRSAKARPRRDSVWRWRRLDANWPGRAPRF